MTPADGLIDAHLSLFAGDNRLGSAFFLMKFKVVAGAEPPRIIEDGDAVILRVSKSWIRRRTQASLKVALTEVARQVRSLYPERFR